MLQEKVIVTTRAGVHARPSAIIAENANKFECEISFIKDSAKINAKSIMGIISMGAAYKTELEIITDGPDEAEAMELFLKLFESKFDEE